MSDAPFYSPGGGEAPQSASNLSPSTPNADQLSAMSELTRRMADMDNSRYAERIRLGAAVHAEIGQGGSGWDALNGGSAKLKAEAEARQIEADRGDAKPAGATPPSEYTALRPEVFGDYDERLAFGTVLSNAGLDARMVAGVVADVAGDKMVSDAIRGGDAAIEARMRDVRLFFERRSGGPEDLRLAVAFGEHLVAIDSRLAPAWNAAMLSENALFVLACEAKRLNFQPTRR